MYQKIIKQKIKKIIKKIAHKFGIEFEKLSTKEDIIGVISKIKPVEIDVPLIRIGGDQDGGYLIPDDLEGVGYCFSPGVGPTNKFEVDLIDRYGVKSYLIDATVNGLPEPDSRLVFRRKFLGPETIGEFISLDDWIKLEGVDLNIDGILQVDIEGSEYGVLVDIEMEVLSKFRIIIFEFHDLELIQNRYGVKFIDAIFTKLNKLFIPVHVHANNETDYCTPYNITIPKNLEVTFYRRDRLKNKEIKFKKADQFPHLLDRESNPNKKPILLSPEWFQNKS